jgi:hypothetical protein
MIIGMIKWVSNKEADAARLSQAVRNLSTRAMHLPRAAIAGRSHGDVRRLYL